MSQRTLANGIGYDKHGRMVLGIVSFDDVIRTADGQLSRNDNLICKWHKT